MVDKSFADYFDDVGADERNKNKKRNYFSAQKCDEKNQPGEDFETADQTKA